MKGYNNIRPLTKTELEKFNSEYIISVNDMGIVLQHVGRNIKTIQSFDGFSVKNKIRKIRISKQAIDMWNEHFKNKKTLFDVQNAISILIVQYQDVTVENVKSQLEKNSNKIKIV